LYQIDKEQVKFTTQTLLQQFPQEHASLSINSLIQLNEMTLVSSADSFFSSDNSIVIWFRSQSSLSYEPKQRITKNQTEGSVSKLIKLNSDEFAASSFSMPIYLVQIWARSKQANDEVDEEKFVIKQKIQANERCYSLLYISITNELICGSYNSIIIFAQSTLFEKRQEMYSASFLSSDVSSLVELTNTTNTKDDMNKLVEFASGHSNGQVMIWRKTKIPKQANSNYSLIKSLQLFDYFVADLLFVDDLNFLIACSSREGKISIVYKYKESKGDLEHRDVARLIQLGGGKNNGVFVSGGGGGGGEDCLKIWEPRFLNC
jgi:hypothetical protein